MIEQTTRYSSTLSMQISTQTDDLLQNCQISNSSTYAHIYSRTRRLIQNDIITTCHDICKYIQVFPENHNSVEYFAHSHPDSSATGQFIDLLWQVLDRQGHSEHMLCSVQDIVLFEQCTQQPIAPQNDDMMFAHLQSI